MHLKELSLLLLITLYIVSGSGCFEDSEWSGKGDLLMDLALEDTNMVNNRNVTNIFILTFTNPNDHALGFLFHYDDWIIVYHERGFVIENNLPDYDVLGPKNSDIIVLEPGENISFIRDDVWSWFIESGERYYAIAYYHPWADDLVTEPYWRGELTSEKLYFSVE